MKNITEKLNKICSLPRPRREEVAKILKECYQQGKKDQKKLDILQMTEYNKRVK